MFDVSVYRLNIHGQDMCISYRTLTPVKSVFNGRNNYIALDFALYNDSCGEGSALGLAKTHFTDNGIRNEIRMILTFPPSATTG